MNKADIAVVVVLYNEQLHDYSIKLKTYIDYVSYVCILDNSDRINNKYDLGCIENLGNNVDYINFGENKGIAYALNYGFRLCKTQSKKYVITLDQDSCFLDSNYLDYSFDPMLAVIFPRYIDGGVMLNENNKLQSGAIFSLEHYSRTIGFCEKYFIDFVDYDMFEQLGRLGYSSKVANDVFLSHHAGTKCRIKNTKKEYVSISPIRYFYLFRNGIDFFLRYKKTETVITLIKLIGKALFQEEIKKKRLVYIYKGIVAFFKKQWGKYDE